MAYVCKLIECYPGFGPTVTTDGNMEDDPATNWPGTGANVAEETTNVHAGCLALKVTATANNGYASQSVTVEEGHRYRIGAWGLRSADGHQWRLRIYIAGSVVWTGDWHNNAAWEEEVKFYRIPDGITTIQLRLEIETDTEICYFDDVTVTRESPVPMTEIDLQYNVDAGFSLLDRGIQPGRPERVSLYGGRLELELVRQEDGKRRIPLRLIVEETDGENLIDRVNALEEMLDHAARYHKDDWGGEVFLVFKIDDATHNVWFPVLEGEIVTDRIYEICGGEKHDMIKDLPVLVTCGPYWESDFTYDLFNILDNPGFEEWNDGICDSEPDCWTLYENITGGTGENYQETDKVTEGCEALRIEVNGLIIGNYKGVGQDLGAGGSNRLRADTEYILLAWVQNDTITGGRVSVYVEGTDTGIFLPRALDSGVANADYTLYSCQFTPNALDVAGNIWIYAIIRTITPPCTGIAHIDKMLVMEASNVPTGWMSSSYLTNHYDRDANEINFLSVCDIPGETEAECAITATVSEEGTLYHVARRTRHEPCNFPWQLLACDAYTHSEPGAPPCTPNLIDNVTCFDSDKIGDGNSPCACHIRVDFNAAQNMQTRAYWPITTNLTNHQGKFTVAVLCRKTGATDTINMQIRMYQDTAFWRQGAVVKIDVPTATDWELLYGWQTMSFPIGSHDDDLWDTGNQWVLEVAAENLSDGAHADNLLIAGAYLIPLDEGHLVAGSNLFDVVANSSLTVQDMDGDKGAFPWDTALNTYYSNVGAVGKYPVLTPEIENWFYFILADFNEVNIDDNATVSIEYRPRGIFLRGANP